MKCLYLLVRACGKVLLLVVWVWLVLPSTASYGDMLPLEFWCQVHGGSSEDHTSPRPWIVENGPTGSLHKCSDLDGVDEEFVWNEGWPENVSYRLLYRGYRVYIPKKEAPVDWRLGLAPRWQSLTMVNWQHVIFDDAFRFQLYPVDGRLRERRLPGERFQQRYQAYRVQAGGGSVRAWGAFHSGAKSPFLLPDRYLNSELYRGILRNTLISAICMATFQG